MNTTVDPDEINHFEKFANEWWRDDGKYKILHIINPLRLKFIRNAMIQHFHLNDNSQPFNNLNILDIGCGGGLLSLPLARLGGNVTGVDASLANITAACEHASRFNLPNLEYVHSAIEHLSANKKYDVIIAFEILEHVSSPEFFIDTCVDLLDKNGLILLSTINRNLKSYATAIFAAENILCWVQKGTHSYNKLMRPSEVSKILEKHGLKIMEMKGLKYNIFRRKWFTSDDISVNYMMKICGT